MKKYKMFLLSILICLFCAAMIGFAACGSDGAQGEKGDTGATGATGEQGEKGDKGDTGDDGQDGDDGLSAYYLYIAEYGYDGSEADWIEDLINGNLVTQKYIVTFDSDGGSEVEAQEVKKGYKATKPEVTKEGYTFEGWYLGEELWSFIGYSVTEDITLTAKWSITTSGVTYTLDEETQECSVTGYTGSDSEVYLCAEYDGHPVTSIAASAFYGSSITYISIPSSITTIGESAFNYCRSLTSVTISTGLAQLGSTAFSNCDNLAEVYYDGALTHWVSIEYGSGSSCPTFYGAALYFANAEGGYDLVEEVTITGVTAVCDSAFYGCTSLKSVTIGADVETIGAYVFKTCYNLESITFEDGGKLVSIGKETFYSCTSLTSMALPEGLETVGDNAFYNNTLLASISVPVSMKSFGGSAFYSSTGLKAVYYAGTATQWASISFGSGSGCPLYNGAELYLEGETETAATEIVIEGIETINGCAFYGCTSITSIVLDSTVKTIENHAFNSCSNLTSVYYKGDSTAYAEISIGTNNTLLTGATWYYYSETQPSESGNYWHYVDGIATVWGASEATS